MTVTPFALARALAVLAFPTPGRTLPDSATVLQVPYVAQSELLCGGAAVAMLERWWGRRGVYAEAFDSLVRPAEGGIRTTDLLAATVSRGWRAEALRGSASHIAESLHDQVPVIVLLRAGPARYHYVVVVGWDSAHVTFHDPAVGPFIKRRTADFLARWNATDRWMMVVRPGAPMTPPPLAPPAPVAYDSLPCRPWLDLAADAAAADRLDAADRDLATAARNCPAEPVVLRELAGVRFRQGRRDDAARLAGEYIARAPTDTLGWQLLAASRYLSGDLPGALDAWNALRRPTVDLVRIDGLDRLRYAVVANAINTPVQQPLTSSALALAARRLADLPTVAASRVGYVAVAGSAVEVHATVVQRPLFDPLPQLVVGNALRALVRSEVALAVNSPLGVGELWSVQWRWTHADPRRAFRFDVPARIGLPGIVSLESSWDAWHYSAALPDQQRRQVSAAFGGWLSPSLEATAGARLEQWLGGSEYVAIRGGAAWHPFRDHLVVGATVEQAASTSGAAGYQRLRSRATWAAGDAQTLAWSVRGGVDWVSAATPAGLWPVAGGDLGRDIPLRAHQFIVSDALPAARTARTVTFGGAGADRAVAMLGPAQLGVGLFVDAADVDQASVTGAPRWYLDAGAGVWIGMPGAASGALRIDVARGVLADPRWGLTVGYSLSPSLRATSRP